MKIALNEYQKFVAKLFAACDVSDYPNSPVLVDTNAISDILEDEFIKVGLLEAEDNEE